MDLNNIKIGVIGLGYVGLPLTIEFGKKYNVLGFDINKKRVKDLTSGHDATMEIKKEDFEGLDKLIFSSIEQDLAELNVYIVTVPTPIDDGNIPDLKLLKNACLMLGKYLKKGDFVIFESTVYPGATEEICIPILEDVSRLKLGKDFSIGYSPERINPGDKVNTLTKIIKITSGSSQEAANFVDALYSSIISAGTYKASSIKVAEAAKVIENTQRDLNIAIINEFAKIFNKLDIDTEEVLNAAGTKWNFLRFKPGLVGGHCISVDPYYLTYKAQEVGYRPEVILAGRRINDGMSEYIATQLVKKLISKKINVEKAKILILGFTFKGDCPDIRNTKIIDVVHELQDFNINIDVYDSWASSEEVSLEYDIGLINTLNDGIYDGVIIAVDHNEFKKMGEKKIRQLCKDNHVLFDVKHVLGIDESDLRL